MRLPRRRNGRQLSVISVRARQFTSIISVCTFLSAAAISATGPVFPKPAAFIRMRTTGCSSLSVFSSTRRNFFFVRSPAKIRTGTGHCTASCSSRSRLLARTQISFRSGQKVFSRITNSLPMPEEAPVTTAIRFILTPSFCGHSVWFSFFAFRSSSVRIFLCRLLLFRSLLCFRFPDVSDILGHIR